MLTGIDPGLTGIVPIPRGIDATPGRDGPARSRIDRARSRELPIATGIDATLHRHRCPSESGRPDQMRSRPDSDRDRCPKSSGRCRSDQGTTLFEWSRCLRTPNTPLTTRDRSHSEALGCHAFAAGFPTQPRRSTFPCGLAHSPGCGPNAIAIGKPGDIRGTRFDSGSRPEC
jgi:hypothetical protein